MFYDLLQITSSVVNIVPVREIEVMTWNPELIFVVRLCTLTTPPFPIGYFQSETTS
jgi:hypothetical protein